MRIETLVNLQFRYRRWLLSGLAALAVVATLGALDLRFDFSPQRVFVSSSPEYVFLERIHEVFGRDDTRVAVHLYSEELWTEESLRFLATLEKELSALDGVAEVAGPMAAPVAVADGRGVVALSQVGEGDPEEMRRAALSQPLIHGRLVSADGGAFLVSVRVADERMGYRDLVPVVDGIFAVLDRVPRPSGLSVGVVGIPVARVLLVGRLIEDQLTYLPICVVVFFFVLWFLFRDPRAVVLLLCAVLLSLLYAAGVMGALGEEIDIVNNVVPTLLFVIGVSDGIHLVSRYRQELGRGADKWHALQRTCVHLSVACFLTSVTTAVGFASLAVGRLDILRRFGLFAAAGVLIAYIVTVVLVPLVLSHMRPILGRSSRQANRIAELWASRLADFTWENRVAILIVGLFVLVGGAILGTRVEVENRLFESFPPGDPLVSANRRLEQDFPGVVPFSVVVSWEEGVDVLDPTVSSYLTELSDFLRGLESMGGVLSPLDLIAEANVYRHGGDPSWRRLPSDAAEARTLLDFLRMGLRLQGQEALLDSLYRPEERLLRVSGLTGDIGSRAIASIAEEVEARLEADSAVQRRLGIECRLSGDGPVGSAAVDRLIGDMARSLVVAFVFIFLVMIPVLRSLRAAVVSMIPNVFPLVLTLGIMGAFGMDLQVPTIIVFSVALGLAVDDTIHFLVRFREELRVEPDLGSDDSYRQAIERTFRGTGQAIFATSVLLATGYSVLLLSSFPITRKFGVGMLLTVIGALLGDLFLLPACLAVWRPFRRSSPRRG